MPPTTDVTLFDKQVRAQVYAHFVQIGQAPAMSELAQALARPLSDVQAAYQRLAAGRALVLQDNGEVLMAEPFSAIPTAFAVQARGQQWWGNCIWDALGIAAMLNADAHIATSCGCCGLAMALEVQAGTLQAAPGVVHYAVPPRDWWNDVVFA
jgi:hypothetical protein